MAREKKTPLKKTGMQLSCKYFPGMDIKKYMTGYIAENTAVNCGKTKSNFSELKKI